MGKILYDFKCRVDGCETRVRVEGLRCEGYLLKVISKCKSEKELRRLLKNRHKPFDGEKE